MTEKHHREELQPCPFCTEHQLLQTHQETVGRWFVCCDCGAAGPHDYSQSREDAITAWNTRPHYAAQAAEVAELKKSHSELYQSKVHVLMERDDRERVLRERWAESQQRADAAEKDRDESRNQYRRLRDAINGSVPMDLEYMAALENGHKRLTAEVAEMKQRLATAEAAARELRESIRRFQAATTALEGQETYEAMKKLVEVTEVTPPASEGGK